MHSCRINKINFGRYFKKRDLVLELLMAAMLSKVGSNKF